jgi:Xaa-Pro aminopeptidase
MYQERIHKLTHLLFERSLDAIAIVPGAGMRYLTGLVFHPSERLTLLLLRADGSTPALVLPALEAERVRAAIRSGGKSSLQLYPWHDTEGPTDALGQAIRDMFRERHPPGLTLAVEYTAMRVMELHALEGLLPDLHTVDATPLLSRLRMVKDRYELAAMVEAVRMIETALRNTIVQIRPGVTERQLAAIWKHEIMATGAEGESFDCMVASGPNSANPHHHNSDRAFQTGDLIILDGGAIAEGYASDITRTVALGQPNDTMRTIYTLVQEANAAGRRAVRPGTSGEAIDAAARAVIASGGYGDYFVHRTGHGLGMECHELPNIVAGNTQALQIGTTFTIEPGIYIPGVGGVRIEDDVVVTEEGGKSLTTFERELLVLPT